MTARLWLLGRRSSTRILVIVLAAAIPGAALARGAAPKSGHTAPAAAPAPVTDANDPLRVVKVLADPKLEGRGVGTAGLDSAGVFIAREMGLRPGEPADTSDPHDPGPDPAQTAG